MSEKPADAGVKSDPKTDDQIDGKAPTGNATVDGAEKTVPKARFDEVNEKKKALEQTLSDVADTLTADVPEEFRDLIPALPPAEKIAWIRSAGKKGLFQKHPESGPDSRRPSGQPPQDISQLSSFDKMKMGYKT